MLSFGLIVSIGFLLLVSLLVSTGLAAFAKWYGAWFPGWVMVWVFYSAQIFLLGAEFTWLYAYSHGSRAPS